jgi:hypothetical protein
MRPLLWLALASLLTAGCTLAPERTPAPSTDPSASKAPGPIPSTGFRGCEGSGPVAFANSPMRLEDFAYLLPYGMMVGAHVTPIDHMYFGMHPNTPRDAFEVRVVADGVLYNLQPRDINVDANTPKAREWRMDIAHSCTFTSYFDLLTSIPAGLEEAFAASQRPGAQPLKLTAGQVVGRIGGQTLDFGVYDYNMTLSGFLVPEHYSEPWKIHTADPFPYFAEPLRTSLLDKMMRQAEPRAGRIDYDVDARMSGNWFAVGTGGYGSSGGERWNYWEGHLAFVPDALDPSFLVLSLGNWSGQSRQFGIQGGVTDPAHLGKDAGVLKLELSYYSYMAGNRDNVSGLGAGPNQLRPGDTVVATNHHRVEGTVLLQLVEDRLLKVETFPGVRAADVSGFSANARLFER